MRRSRTVSTVCPHAAIRVKVVDESAVKNAPEGFKYTPAKGSSWKAPKSRCSPFPCPATTVRVAASVRRPVSARTRPTKPRRPSTWCRRNPSRFRKASAGTSSSISRNSTVPRSTRTWSSRPCSWNRCSNSPAPAQAAAKPLTCASFLSSVSSRRLVITSRRRRE